MQKQLLRNPNLESLISQAKDLYTTYQSGYPSAYARIRAISPKFSDAASQAEFSLRDAQLVIAREYGFSSWSELKRHIESRQTVRDEIQIPAAARTVIFPTDFSMGSLWVCDWDEEQQPSFFMDFLHWKRWGKARGEVNVPAGQKLALHLSEEGRRNLDFLRDLGSNDLQGLTAMNPETAAISHMTGLQYLVISRNSYNLSDESLSFLGSLRSLKFLTLYRGYTIERGLSVLKELPALKGLILAGMEAKKMRLSNRAISDVTSILTLEDLWLFVMTGSTDEGYANLHQLRSLKKISITDVDGITDEIPRQIKDLPITHLCLDYNGVTDIGLLSIAEGRRSSDVPLIGYTVKSPHVTDDGIESILDESPLDEIESYIIGGCSRCTDRSLRYVNRMTNLRELVMPITDAALDSIEALPHLENLNFSRTQITDGGISNLIKLKSLRRLNLTDTAISDRCLESTEVLTDIEFLNLSRTRITDDGIPNLLKLKQLRSLTLRDTAISDNGLQRLQDGLPRCQIYAGRRKKRH